jgi:ParB family chromosome partitioning protein
MAKLAEFKEIKLQDLVIGKGQVRLSEVGKDIDELAESIKKQGLLQPIVVCPAEKKGKYEVLLGQRRIQAFQMLQRDTILAAVLDEKVDTITAKVISLTENLVRRDLNRRDMIDVCTALYKKYGSMKDVADSTGLPYHKVRDYVKYDRLKPELRKLVDNNEIDVKTALRAQDAASASGEYNPDDAKKFAIEMKSLDSTQQVELVRKRETDPDVAATDVIEAVKSGPSSTEIKLKLGIVEYRSLNKYAKAEETTIEDAAMTLITEGLTSKGVLEE